MPFKIEIKAADTNWYDVSDFITDVADLPYITRNDDYTLVHDYVNIKQSFAYTTKQFAKGDQVLIWSGSQLLFNGVIADKKSNQGNFEHQYKLEDSLIRKFKLGNYKLRTSDMAEFINPYTVQKTILTKVPTHTADRWINVYDLMYAIFNRIGMTVDTTYLFYHGMQCNGYNFTYVPNAFVQSYEDVLTIGTDTLWLWVPMMYGMNQNYIWSQNYIDTHPDLIDLTPSIYDVLSFLQSILNVVFIPKSATEYYIISNTSTVPVKDANFDADYEYNTLEPKYAALSLKHKNFDNTDTYYPFEENKRFSYFPFFPNLSANARCWLEENSIGGQEGWPTYFSEYRSGYGSLGKEKNEITIMNFFMLFELLPYGGMGNLIRIPFPQVNTKQTILKNIFDANLGVGSEIIYENLINTEYHSKVNENYIQIDSLGGKIPSSKIKITTFDTSTI